MRAVAYIRVSSLTQVEGHSLDAQERFFYELCKNKGWEVVHIYREEGKSAHVEAIARRPVFRKLHEDVTKHEFDIIVVHTFDRWSRNLKVTLESLSILAKHNVSLVSISENIDYSSPQGKLFTQMLGSFAEYFSESLSNHVSKGMDQRALEGRHVGGIPFGYESCWVTGEKDQKTLKCIPEHKAGIHVIPEEGEAVKYLFHKYTSGTTTLGQLAVWLNEQGFRTRNTRKLADASGNLVTGPKLFTASSVKGILHNSFYTGKVSYKGKLHPGAHDPLVSEEIFNLVQITLKKNSGRSETLQARPEREYLLKGIIRCVFCGMPMWAQTYHSGITFYREQKYSRSQGDCPSAGGTITCHIPDEQIGSLIGSIKLGPRWLEEVLAILSLKDEVTRIKKSRQDIQERLRRMAKAYVDGLFPDDEYKRQKRLMEMELESLVIPEVDAAQEAGKLIINLPKLWASANASEKRKLILSVLDAVYVDAKQTKTIIAIKPKPPFVPIFEVAVSDQNADIRIYKNGPEGLKPKDPSVFLVETGETSYRIFNIFYGAMSCICLVVKRFI